MAVMQATPTAERERKLLFLQQEVGFFQTREQHMRLFTWFFPRTSSPIFLCLTLYSSRFSI